MAFIDHPVFHNLHTPTPRKLTGMDKKGRKMAGIGHDLGTLVHQANLFDVLSSSC